MSTHTIQALRDQIDAQLATLSLPEEERVLKSRRNQLAPISVLPAEVLAKIIRLTILEYDREKERNQSTYRQHVIIASVCQSWRAVIIGDRMLWTKVEWPYLPFVPLLLERSGMAPLSIDFSALPILLNGKGGWPKKLTRDALNLIAQHHHRIQELAMDFETLYCEYAPLPFLDVSSPNLEHCNLKGYYLSSISLPQNLFRGSAPRMTILQFESICFSWDMPLLRSLPCLEEFTLVSARAIYSLSLNQLANVFAAMPNLQELTIDKSFPMAFETPATNTTIRFPQLLRLTLRGYVCACSAFLNCSSFGRKPSFDITLHEDLDPSTYPKLLPWLSRVWMKPSQPPTSIDSLYIFGGCFANSYSFTVASEDERCRLEWDPLFHVEEPPVNFTTWLVSTLPLKGCTYLRSRIWFTQEEWQVCADSIPDLEELNIAPGRAGQQNLQMFFDLIDVLIPHNSQTPLPKLTHLIIEYRATEEGCERLINMMRLRKDAGCDLEYVAIGMVQTLAVGRKAEIEEDMKQIVKEVEVVEL